MKIKVNEPNFFHRIENKVEQASLDNLRYELATEVGMVSRGAVVRHGR